MRAAQDVEPPWVRVGVAVAVGVRAGVVALEVVDGVAAVGLLDGAAVEPPEVLVDEVPVEELLEVGADEQATTADTTTATDDTTASIRTVVGRRRRLELGGIIRAYPSACPPASPLVRQRWQCPLAVARRRPLAPPGTLPL